MAIDKHTVQYAAHLARIELGEDELEKLSGQLHDIVGFIDALRTLDLKDIQPTSHILPLSNVMREDIPRQSLAHEKTLAHAPCRQDAFFVVPPVIE